MSETVDTPSLVLGKNDCNNRDTRSPKQSTLRAHCDESETEETGGRYDCRDVYPNFYYENEDEGTAPFRCGQWDCYCCGYRMRMNLIEEIEELVRNHPELRRFVTLTLDPKKLTREIRGDKKRMTQYLMNTWRKFRVYIQREYGDFSFVWVKERGEKNENHWHLHILVSRYLDQSWISEAWSAVGGGEVVDIRRIARCEKVAHYLGKYLTKNALSNFPDGVQRYGTSEDIDLDVRQGGYTEENWTLKIDDHLMPMVSQNNDENPLSRRVVNYDFVQQREWGGPVPPPYQADYPDISRNE